MPLDTSHLVTAARHGEPAKLVVHLRLDDLDPPAPAAEAPTPAAAPNPGLHLVPDTTEPAEPAEPRPAAWIEDGLAIPLPTAGRITCTGRGASAAGRPRR